MTDKQMEVQKLLDILQTRPWTKTERASARQQINLYHERTLARLQHALFERVLLGAPERLDPFEVDEYIHRYHKQSQELYVYMNSRSPSNDNLPLWLKAIDEDDRGIAVWHPTTRLPRQTHP